MTWIRPQQGGGSGGTDHALLASLDIASCGHTGPLGSVWTFDGAGGSVAIVGVDGDFLRRVAGVWVASPAPVAIGSAIIFFGTGYYRVANAIDVQERDVALAINEVVLLREIAGTAGTTEIDVLVNGVSMFLPANRPQLLFSTGNQARVAVVPDFPILPANARLEMNILSAEDGNPQDITVLLFPV